MAPSSRWAPSWDVKAHGHRPMELYGTEASLIVPDPNFFGGTVELVGSRRRWRCSCPDWEHPLGVPNQEHKAGHMANYRTAGLAEWRSPLSRTGRFAARWNSRCMWWT